MIKKYFDLFRIKHYIKNIFVFTVIIFGSRLFTSDFYRVFFGFISFCLLSSSIYIINDIADYNIDRKTLSKKNEPIASGIISIKKALIISIILLILSFSINYFTYSLDSYIYLFIYFLLNIFYSCIGKNIPYLELLIMSSFYLLRVIYGAVILNDSLSLVLVLAVLFGSLYIIILKRISEIKCKKQRPVLKHYNQKLLRILSIICLIAVIVVYVCWTIIKKNLWLMMTVIIIIIIFLTYDNIAKNTKKESPIDILYDNKFLLILGIIYGIIMIVLAEIYL